MNGAPITLHLYVEDGDAGAVQAVDASAKLTMEVADMLWGVRFGQVRYPFDHKWSLATRTRDLKPEEI